MSDMFDRITAKAQGSATDILTPEAQPFFGPRLAEDKPLETGGVDQDGVPPTVPVVPIIPTLDANPTPQIKHPVSKPTPADGPPMLHPVSDAQPVVKPFVTREGDTVPSDATIRETQTLKEVVREVTRDLQSTTHEVTHYERTNREVRSLETTEKIRERIKQLHPADHRATERNSKVERAPLTVVTEAHDASVPRSDPVARSTVNIGQIRVTAPPPKPAPAPQPVIQVQPHSAAPKGQALKSFLGWRR